MTDLGSALLVLLWPCSLLLAALARLGLLWKVADPFAATGLSKAQIFGMLRQAPELVGPISGEAPPRPVVAESCPFKTPETQEMAWKAARFLFMHYGFLRIPGQFWPVFQKADYDPGVAMTNFLGAIGCNPELVRHGDRREQQKAREVIELLVRSTWVLQRIRSERKRSEIGRFLQSGDYVRVRELAEALTHIAAALGMASNWSKEKVIAACESRARELARYLRNPPMTATEVAGLREEIAQLVVQQSRFDDLLRHYDGVRKAIEAGWPADWMPESPLWREKSRLYREVGAIVGDLSSAEGLRPKQVAERLDHLAEIVAGLDRLAAEAAGYGSTGAPKPLQRQVDHQVEATAALLEEALGSFGFSRQNPPDSLETLKREWLRRTDELQPDRYMTAPDEVYTKANEEYLRLMAGFEHLVSYFGWTRPAEA